LTVAPGRHRMPAEHARHDGEEGVAE